MSWSDWSDVLAVRLRRLVQHEPGLADLQFREQGSGAFVHMTSTSALIGNFGQANYMAAKFGVVGLSRGIALDMQAALQGALELHGAFRMDQDHQFDSR